MTKRERKFNLADDVDFGQPLDITDVVILDDDYYDSYEEVEDDED